MGPRRVGKTILLNQCIQRLLGTNEGIHKKILYVSIDSPIYTDIPLRKFIELFCEENAINNESRAYVFFDEVQYLKDWERHLKTLVDACPGFQFVASGSAAAALKLKSQESGAGRFTDFPLPPLTFHEYLLFTDSSSIVEESDDSWIGYRAQSMKPLNDLFLEYLNFGGYPEAAKTPEIRQNPSRYIRNDIIDKVLLRDLPTLYGIQDIQELNRLFTTVAYNSGSEVGLDGLASRSGVAKPTIKRYLEYLEAAFLIQRVRRIDERGGAFRRERGFKVYLTNPSMRAALFEPLSERDRDMGALVETGIFSQWAHSDASRLLRYARWKKGEVDLVALDRAETGVEWAVEIKWSDRILDHLEELRPIAKFARGNRIDEITVTTRTCEASRHGHDMNWQFVPAALYCYAVGRKLVDRLKKEFPMRSES